MLINIALTVTGKESQALPSSEDLPSRQQLGFSSSMALDGHLKALTKGGTQPGSLNVISATQLGTKGKSLSPLINWDKYYLRALERCHEDKLAHIQTTKVKSTV